MTVTVETTPGDLIAACVRLADRAGATSWQLRWDCPHLPMNDPAEEDGHNCDGVTWAATVEYTGARIFQTGPTAHEAALALAVRLMSGAMCRCGRDVTLGEHGGKSKCRWRLEGDQWIPGCDADPVTIAKRGDYDAVMAAFSGGNRAQRRAAKRSKRRNPSGY